MPAAPGSTALDAAYAAFADAMLEAAVAAEPTEWGGLIASASEEVGALAGTVPTGETLNAMKTTLDTVTKTLRDGGAPPDLSESIDGAGEAFASYVKAVAGVPAQVPVPEVARATEAGADEPAATQSLLSELTSSFGDCRRGAAHLR